MSRLREVRYARRYLLGQSLSLLGDTSLWLALVIWVRELTGSNADAGLSFFFLGVTSLAAPLWGAMVDRLRRRPVLIVVNAVSGLMTLSLLFVHDRHQVWIIWAVLVGYGISNSVLGAAQSGFLYTLLPHDLLGEAQGVLATVREGSRLVSPLIGAGLFAIAGGHVVALIDAATFAVATLTVASITVTEPRPVRSTERFRTELAAGLTHIRQHVRIRQVVTALVVICSVVGFIETAFVAVVTDGLDRPATWLGPLEAVTGVGAVIGGLTVAVAMRKLGEGRVSAVGMIAVAMGVSTLMVTTISAALAGSLITGFGLPWLIAASFTLIQRSTPTHLQGRVSACVDVLTGTPQSISIAVGAGLVTVIGFQVMLGVVGVVTLASGTWLLTRPEQRLAPGTPPDTEDLAPADLGVAPVSLLAAEPIFESRETLSGI